MFGDLRKDATRVKVDTARIGRAGGALEKYAEKAVHGARKLVAKMFGRKTDTRWARARRHIEKKVIAESRKREEKEAKEEQLVGRRVNHRARYMKHASSTVKNLV